MDEFETDFDKIEEFDYQDDLDFSVLQHLRITVFKEYRKYDYFP